MNTVAPPVAAATVPQQARVASPRAGVSPLMYASQQGDVEKVRRLLRAQVSVPLLIHKRLFTFR